MIPPHHTDYESTLSETEKLVKQALEVMDAFIDNDQESKYEKLHGALVEVCLDVLKQLDKEGVFSAINRSSFVLNLLNGDQSNEERLERSAFLNPQNVHTIYKSEI